MKPPTPDKETATVAGNVLRLDTGEPVKRAQVTLNSHGSDGVYVFYLTDEQGRFVFENVPPGSYDLSVSRNGR
jgi:protocatechuate 3,4-dioxygenase beta subunit